MRRLLAATAPSDVALGVARAVCLLAAGAAVVARFTRGDSPVAGVMGLALGLAVLVALWRGIGSGLAHATWSGAGLVLLAVIAAASFGWAAAFSSVQASDFGVYWRCGVDDAASLANLMEACRSKYISMERLYGERTLLYTMPFGALFGANYPLFKLYNAALHVLTAAVVWAGCRRLAGPRAAFIAIATTWRCSRSPG